MLCKTTDPQGKTKFFDHSQVVGIRDLGTDGDNVLGTEITVSNNFVYISQNPIDEVLQNIADANAPTTNGTAVPTI